VTLGVCNFDCIAKVSLGFKSLQNQFFYITQEIIDKYGIEEHFNKPIFQLGDLEPEKYLQDVQPVQAVFYCKEGEADLRGTGALKYIRAMEKVPAAEKKQAGKRQTIKQALQDQTSKGGLWYAPKAQHREMNIWLRKAVSTRYSPFLFDSKAAVDQRCNYVSPIAGIEWKEMAAILTSSLFALSAESFGASSMGAGALELATTQIQELRVVDLRDLKDASEKKDLIKLAEAVWKTKPVDWEDVDRPPQEVQDLDKWLLSRMKTGVTLDRLYADLVRTMKSRLTLAGDKNVQTKKHEAVNIATVVRSIAESVRPLFDSQSFPDSFVPQGVTMQALDFSRNGKLEIESHPMMMENILIVRNGTQTLFEQQLERSVAQVIIKALLLGRRKFSYPVNGAAATVTLNQFSNWFPKVLEKITAGCGMSAVGTSYETKVHAAVLDFLHLDRNIMAPEFFGDLAIHS
jgi:hypothetical protein